MPSLTIRNISKDVIEQIRETASEEHRSVNAQVLHWLERAVQERLRQEELDQLGREIRVMRDATFRRHGIGSDSARLLRKMRDERTKLGARAGR